MQPNYYTLMRNFWDFAFEHPEKVKPNHCALYCFAVEHCNRLGWNRKFGLPSGMVMSAIGMKSYSSYIKAFNELIDFGFFELIEKSKNQWSSNIIALSYFDKAHDKALDKAMIKHASKQSESTHQSTRQSNDSINRQIYQYTNLPNNQSTFKNENFILELKNGSEWLNTIAMQNGINKDAVIKYLEQFEIVLKSAQDNKSSKKDLCGHFSRWLPIELKKSSGYGNLNEAVKRPDLKRLN
jgi:hypothetical protein